MSIPDPCGLPVRYWNLTRPRFCPACLAEDSYWRAAWDLKYVTACSHHRVRLRDVCEACGRRLSWRRQSLLTCPCGSDLSAQSSELAGAECGALATEVITRLLKGGPSRDSLFPELKHLGLEALLKLVHFLGAYAVAAGGKPQKIAGLDSVTIAEQVCREGAASLLAWPDGFEHFLERQIERYRQSEASGRLQKHYGPLYRALFATFRDQDHAFLRTALDAHVGKSWQGQLARRNSRLSEQVRESHDWVPLKKAAQALGVRSQAVLKFIETGKLEGRVYQTAGGRTFGSVSRASLDALVEARTHWVTLKDLREQLGLSRKRATALMAAGVIRPFSGPAIDESPVWLFDRRELLPAVESLKSSKA